MKRTRKTLPKPSVSTTGHPLVLHALPLSRRHGQRKVSQRNRYGVDPIQYRPVRDRTGEHRHKLVPASGRSFVHGNTGARDLAAFLSPASSLVRVRTAHVRWCPLSAWQDVLLIFYLVAMHPLRSVMIYIAGIFLGGALLAPWLYWTVQWLAPHFTALDSLAQQPFHRFLNRSLLGLAIIGLWPFLRSLGVKSWSAIGLSKPAGQWSRLASGFAVGLASLACVALLAIATDGRRLNPDLLPAALLSKFCGAGLSAVVVAVLEELLFRGAVFGALRQVHHWLTALVTSSVIYALVHFFRKAPSPPEITWSSGLELLPRMLAGFAEVETLLPGFFTLTVAGMILALAYYRTGSLYFSIGLHAGWIFWLKAYGFLTRSQPGASTWFWGTAKLIDGWLALIVLTSMLGLLWFCQRRSQPSYAS